MHIYKMKGVNKISCSQTVLLVPERFLKENNTKKDKQIKQITAELLWLKEAMDSEGGLRVCPAQPDEP